MQLKNKTRCSGHWDENVKMGSEVVERVKGREKRVCHRKLREEKVLSHDSPKVASRKRRKTSLFVSGILKR